MESVKKPTKREAYHEMCVSPNFIHIGKGPGFERLEVPCQKCWACRKNKQNDLIGRAMAEMAYADDTVFLTLTYDDRKLEDPSQTRVIWRRDFQNFLKLYRKRVGKIRYVVAGEYGTKKGRVHFHAILFTYGHCPCVPLKMRFWWPELWPWGHLWAETANIKTIKYVAKYLTKSRLDKTGSEWVSYSRFPILGSEFVIRTGLRAASAKVFPRDFNYFPPGYNGRPRLKFTFYGRAQELLLDTIFEHWPEAHAVPKTEWMENAMRRYRRIKAERYWNGLSIEDKKEHLKMLDPSPVPVPRQVEELRNLLRQNEVDLRLWREREKERIEETIRSRDGLRTIPSPRPRGRNSHLSARPKKQRSK